MKPFEWSSLLDTRVIAGAFAVAAVLVLVTLLSIGWSRPAPQRELGFAPADLTVIPASSSTPNVTATATADPLLAGTPTLAPDVVGVGGYVQISGTDGDPLRLRAAPSLTGEPLFLGYAEEVFEVRDGPQQADGYTWWYLVAPYDESRAGWAAAAFLTPIPPP